MYGTVARFRLKPGMLEHVRRFFDEMEPPPGQVWRFVYQMDADPDEVYVAAAFESKAAYVANANRPEQHAKFMHFAEMLQGEPEWHNGEIVSAHVF
jgi:quinol monooxygenase YgiN